MFKALAMALLTTCILAEISSSQRPASKELNALVGAISERVAEPSM